MTLGWHTAFRIPFVAGSRPEDVRLKIGAGTEYLHDMRTYLPTWDMVSISSLQGELNAGTFIPYCQAISRHFRQSDGHSMTMTDIRSGVQIRDEHLTIIFGCCTTAVLRTISVWNPDMGDRRAACTVSARGKRIHTAETRRNTPFLQSAQHHSQQTERYMTIACPYGKN